MAAPAATGEPARPRHPVPVSGWGWPPRADRAWTAAAAIRREWLACVFGVSAVFAAVTALISFNAPERVWGGFAAVSYAGAAVMAALAGRRGSRPAVRLGAVGRRGSRLAVPPGLAGRRGSRPAVPPGLVGRRGSRLAVPPGLAGRRGSRLAVPPGLAGRRGSRLAVLLGLAGALAAPLAWMAVTGLAQPEVAVILRSAAMLVHRGTPYASPAALAAAHNWHAYDPYLPALIVFGIPRVLGGGLLTDPRVWFGLAFAASLAAALRAARAPRPVWWTLLVMATPVVALPLAVGGDDLPVLGLICLGLTLAGRAGRDRLRPAAEGQWRGADRDQWRRDGRADRDQWHGAGWRPWGWAVAAGLALGLAAAMKATAWPAVALVALLLAARQGWRAVGWFTAAVLGVVLVTDGPVVAGHPAAALANTVLYPLGLANVASPAASMLPGHLLAGAGSWGHWTALALMALAGTGIGAWLITRPPTDFRDAGWRLALGLALLFLLAPASRVGYFVYPLGLAAFLLLCRWPRMPDDPSVNPEPQGRRLAVQVHD